MKLGIGSLILGVLLLLGSCRCSSFRCILNEQMHIEMKGYNANVKDSLFVYFYEKGTSFSQYAGVDTFYTYKKFDNTDSLISNSYLRLSEYYDYKVVIASDSNQFKITRVDFDEENTNKACGPFFASFKIAEAYCTLIGLNVEGDKASVRSDNSILLIK